MLQRPYRYLAGLDLMYYLVLALSFRDTTASSKNRVSHIKQHVFFTTTERVMIDTPLDLEQSDWLNYYFLNARKSAFS